MKTTNEEAIKQLQRRCRGCDALIGGDNNCYDCEYKIAVEALEKQIPMKPIDDKMYHMECPNCGERVIGEYCSNCGQKIDWSEK